METNSINKFGVSPAQQDKFAENIRKIKKTIGDEVRKVFSLPDRGSSKKVEKPSVAVTNDISLNKLLSAEEKKLFELLFPATEAVKSGKPIGAYTVQQKHTERTKNTHGKILGSRFDIIG